MIYREYEVDGYKVTEYTNDGKSVSATVREQIVDLELIPETQSQPTTEEKLANLQHQLQEQQQQNLILVDINLTVYEELLKMKDQLAQVNGATENA